MHSFFNVSQDRKLCVIMRRGSTWVSSLLFLACFHTALSAAGSARILAFHVGSQWSERTRDLQKKWCRVLEISDCRIGIRASTSGIYLAEGEVLRLGSRATAQLRWTFCV